MENFFINDKFYMDLCDLIDDLDGIDNLSEDWKVKVELSDLEPIFKVDAKKLLEILCDCNEERLGEDFDTRDEERILKAIKESCDFEKLKELLPNLYYPNNKFHIITKQDLIDYAN